MKLKALSSPFNSPSGLTVFDSLFELVNPVHFSDGGISSADALILWGGTDIHPSFYKQTHKHIMSEAPQEPSQRDWFEWELMHLAADKKIPIIGVCRGAQFICAFAGGSLIQHAQGHLSSHEVTTFDGGKFTPKANHHQIMNPYGTAHDVLAWTTPGRFTKTFSPAGQEIFPKWEQGGSPEVVYFSDINALAIQPHPEWELSTSPFNEWIKLQINSFLLNRNNK